jgi:hypothetical protein
MACTANPAAGQFVGRNLIPATLGNMVGGGFFVGCMYALALGSPGHAIQVGGGKPLTVPAFPRHASCHAYRAPQASAGMHVRWCRGQPVHTLCSVRSGNTCTQAQFSNSNSNPRPPAAWPAGCLGGPCCWPPVSQAIPAAEHQRRQLQHPQRDAVTREPVQPCQGPQGPCQWGCQWLRGMRYPRGHRGLTAPPQADCTR